MLDRDDMRQRTFTVCLFIFEIVLISFFWRQTSEIKKMMPLAMLGEVALIGAFSKEFLAMKRRGDHSVTGARKRYVIAALGLFGLIAVGLGAVSGIWILTIGIASAVLTLVGKLLTIRFVSRQGMAEAGIN